MSLDSEGPLSRICNALILQSPISTWIADRDGMVIFENAAARRLLRIETDEDVVGKHNILQDQALAAAGVMPQIREVSERGGSTELIVDYDSSKTGFASSRHPIHKILCISMFAVKDDRGQVRNVVIQHRDITDEQEFKNALSESEARYRQLVEEVSDWVWEVDLNGRYLYVSPVIERILGYKPEEVIGLTAFDLIIPEDRERCLAVFQAAIKARGEITRLLNANRRKDGSIRCLETSGRPIFDADGQLIGYRGVDRDVTERIEAERALEAERKRFKALIENASDLITVLDADGTVQYVSPAVRNILGYEPDELIGKKSLDYVHPDDCEDGRRGLAFMAKHEGVPITAEFRLRRKDGEWRMFEAISRSLLKDPFVHGIVFNHRDITRRARAEKELRESEEKFRTLAENANAIIGIVQGSKFAYINPYFERLSGYSHDELMAVDISQVVAPESRELVVERSKRRQMGLPEPPHYEFKIITKSGEERWLDFSSASITYRGQPAIVGVAYDVTDKNNAREALARSEARLQAIFDNVPAGILLYDRNGVILQVNKDFERSSGYSADAVVGRSISETIGRHEDPKKLEDWIGRVFAGETLNGVEWKSVRPDGTIVYVYTNATPIFNEKGEVEMALSSGIDITERKQAEEALRKSEERLSAIFENASASVLLYDKNGVILQVNRAFELSTGYTVDMIVGHSLFDTIGRREDRQKAEDVIRRVFAGETVNNVEWKGVRPDGTIVHTSTNTTPIFNDQGQVEMALAVGVDVTERRQAEEEVKRSEERYRLLFEKSPIPMWVYDRDTLAFIEVNDAAIEHYGYSLEEFLSMTIKDIRPPEDVPALMKTVSRVRRGLQHTGTWRHIKKDGALIYVEITASPMAVGGKPATLVLANDITERREAEEALRESEARYRELVETMNVGLAQADADYMFTYVNQSFANMLGRTPEEMIGHPLLEFVHEDYHELMLRQISARRSGAAGKYEMAWQSKDGRKVYTLASPKPILDEEGKFAGSTAVLTDITERVEAEERLRESEERLARILETTPSGTVILNRDGWITFANEAAERILGLSREQITQRSYDAAEWRIATVDGEPLPSDELLFAKVMRTGDTIYNVEHAIKRPNGQTAILSINAAPLRGPSGEIAGVVASLTDITERRLAQQALEEAESKYRTLVEQSLVGVYMIQDGRFVYVNPQQAHMLGYPEDELIGKPFIDAVAPESRELVEENMRRRLSGETRTVHYTFKAARKDGRVIDMEVLGSRTMFNGRPAVLGTAMDVTERKEAAERAAELEEHKRNFYRRTILAATEGKLDVTEREAILRIAGPPTATWEIQTGDSLSRIRQAVARIVRSEGMCEDRICDFILTVGESTTNAYKHAGGGTASLHRVDGDFMIVVSDTGKGMEALALPEVAFTKGYTTAKSLGMGYKAILSLADKVYLATGPAGTTVAIQMSPCPVKQPIPIMSLPDTW